MKKKTIIAIVLLVILLGTLGGIMIASVAKPVKAADMYSCFGAESGCCSGHRFCRTQANCEYCNGRWCNLDGWYCVPPLEV